MFRSNLLSGGEGTVDRTGRRASKRIQRETGRTFHVATRLLPPRFREATYVLYAFFRIADEVVDDPGDPDPAAQRAELARIRAAALGDRDADDPVLEAVSDLRTHYDIPDEEFEIFLDAMERDVAHHRYDTYDDLETYLRGSSVAVAYMMLAVMDPDESEAARPHAKALGEAFQLTNFLRDVKEDIDDYGRVYLPQRTLRKHGVTEAQLEAGEFSTGFADAMREELRRTERLYREGVAGIRHLPEGCQFAVLLAAVLYAEHHRLIREQGYDVLTSRPELSLGDRLRLLARTWVHWRRSRDPQAVFYRVSAVSESPEGVAEPAPGRSTRSAGALVRRLPSWLAGVTDR